MSRPSQVLAPLDVFRPPVPHVAVLAGRARPIRLCHGDPQWCLACLNTIANELAREMGWSDREALNRSAAAYQSELAGKCSMHSARELRRLTVAACLDHWELLRPEMYIADENPELLPPPAFIGCAFDFVPFDVPTADHPMLRNLAWIWLPLAAAALIGMVRS